MLLTRNTKYSILHQVRSTFHVVRAASAKFDLHAGNMEVNTQHEEWNHISIFTRRISPVYFSVHEVYEKNIVIKRKIIKNLFLNCGNGVAIFTTFFTE
jgi:hypothetical protein